MGTASSFLRPHTELVLRLRLGKLSHAFPFCTSHFCCLAASAQRDARGAGFLVWSPARRRVLPAFAPEDALAAAPDSHFNGDPLLHLAG